MGKLTENFNKTESAVTRLKNLEKDIEFFERENSNNAALVKYIKMLKRKEKLQEDISILKNVMYESMLEDDINLLEGKHINISLKKPYVKGTVDTKKFLKDNPKGSKLYNKYYKETICKGNVTIKEVK